MNDLLANEANWLTHEVQRWLDNVEHYYNDVSNMAQEMISLNELADKIQEEYDSMAEGLDDGDGDKCDWRVIAYWVRGGQTDEQFVRDRFPDECELFDDVKSRQWTDLDLFEALYISGELDSDEGWEFDDVEESKENSESLPKVNLGIAEGESS